MLRGILCVEYCLGAGNSRFRFEFQLLKTDSCVPKCIVSPFPFHTHTVQNVFRSFTRLLRQDVAAFAPHGADVRTAAPNALLLPR